MSRTRLPGLIISPVDFVSSRLHTWDRLLGSRDEAVWLDLGNNASNGQVIIGIAEDSLCPTVIDHYLEIESPGDETPQDCALPPKPLRLRTV